MNIDALNSIRDYASSAQYDETFPFIILILEELMADLAQIQQDIQALQDAEAAAATELATLASQVAQLQSAGPALVTQADLDALHDSIGKVTSALATATTSATSTTTTGGGTTPPTPGPTPQPTPSPTPTTSASKPVYTFAGDPTAVNTPAWPPANEDTTDTPPKPLFNYIGDVQNTDGSWTVNGLVHDTSGEWALYTGTIASSTTPTSAPAPTGPTAAPEPGAPTPAAEHGELQQSWTGPETVENTGSVPGSSPVVGAPEFPGAENQPAEPGQASPGG